MNTKKPDRILTRDVVDSGKEASLKGYLNEQEFIDAVPKNYKKWAGLGFAVAFGLALLESFATTYTGPLAPLVAAFGGVVIAYIKTMRSAKQFINEGDDIHDRS